MGNKTEVQRFVVINKYGDYQVYTDGELVANFDDEEMKDIQVFKIGERVNVSINVEVTAYVAPPVKKPAKSKK